MKIQTPISLTYAGLFLKIISLMIVLLAMSQIKTGQDKGMIVFMELFSVGLFIVAWKMQNHMQEWARLTCWAFALLVGAYFIQDYMIQAFSHLTHPPAGQLLLGACFIQLFVYLSQPRVKRLFLLKR